MYFIGAKDKRALLDELLADPAKDRVLVFTRTKRGADRVCKQLKQAGIDADALHGNKAQNARVRALEAFRAGKVRVLVATDIAARGIDVPNISHVINYELPNEPESYVHRIGRTARAGRRRCRAVILRSKRAAISSGDRSVDEAQGDRGRASSRRDAIRGGSRGAAARTAFACRKGRRRGHTRSPRISEIPMLAGPAPKRNRVSHHSGGGHR